MKEMTVLGAALLFCLCAVVLRELGWRGTPVFCVLAMLLLLSMNLSGLRLFGQSLSPLMRGEGGEAAGAVCKVVGLGVLFGLCADICRELGEGTVAKGVELCGRMAILGVGLPYLGKLIDFAVELVK